MPLIVEQQVVTPALTQNASKLKGCSAMQGSAAFGPLGAVNTVRRYGTCWSYMREFADKQIAVYHAACEFTVSISSVTS
jgi:hypothetical protein